MTSRSKSNPSPASSPSHATSRRSRAPASSARIRVFQKSNVTTWIRGAVTAQTSASVGVGSNDTVDDGGFGHRSGDELSNTGVEDRRDDEAGPQLLGAYRAGD